jgi:DNA-binding SARP family transcriptional activator
MTKVFSLEVDGVSAEFGRIGVVSPAAASAVSVEIGVLGPLTLYLDGHRQQVGSRSERGLLALLALNCGRVVSAGILIDALWGDSPPSSAAKGLQVHVSNLRKKLPAGVIETVPPGYVLTIDPESVDVLQFVHLLDAASLEVDPRARAAILSESLGLWRGSPLEDTAEHDVGRSEATRLEEMRLDAEEQRFEALLAAGEDHSLVAELQASVDAEPLREERWSQLMVALFRAGRRSDALRTFQQLRHHLDEEIGVEPGPRVSTLESRIIQDDTSLLWVEARESVTRRSLPLPSRLASTSPPALLGRTTELQEIASAVKRVAAGDGLELVLITGEPGIGKTTLLAEAARRAHSLGAVALFGHGNDELRSPYQLFAEALQHFVTHADYADVAKLRPHAGPLISLVPDLKRRLPGVPMPPPSDPEAERYVLFSSALRAIETMCEEVPVILVLDDLQWADQASLILLLHLITMGSALRILVMASYRADESVNVLDSTGDIGTLRQDPKCTEISLRGFSPTEVSSFLNMALSSGVDSTDALSEALYAETDGNPLFVTEVVRHLVNRPGVFDETSGIGDGAAVLPASLSDIIGSRVNRLGQSGPEILSTASVFGQVFEVDLLAHAVGRSYLEVLDLLEAAARVFLVKETVDAIGRFEFTHLLIRRVLYETLGATRRAGMHGLIAQTLEDDGEASDATKAAELAGHWAQSGSKEGRLKAIGRRRLASTGTCRRSPLLRASARTEQ